MDLASASCAIQNLWLTARAEGLGMGWVSLFDPAKLAELLHMPEGASPIAVLCLGYVEAFYPRPMLEIEQWAERIPLDTLVYQDRWES
jgi:5,6-dimethylbenzimidazole synthase